MTHGARTWWQRLSNPGARGGRRHRATARTPRFHRPGLEGLEQRTLLSVTLTPTNNYGLGYTGLDYAQSDGSTPPDTNGAAGPSSYVESVNQTLAIYSTKATEATAVTSSFSTFWYTQGNLTKTDSGSSLSDPIVIYDDQIGRFIVGDQDVDSSTFVSNFDLAVSRMSNPATLSASDWNFYQISTTEPGYVAAGPGNLGYNHDALVFTPDESYGGGNPGATVVMSVNASDLASGVSQSQLLVYQNDISGINYRPTTMHDAVAGDPMWLVAEGGNDRSLSVVKMTSVLTNAATFTTTNLAVNPYSPIAYPVNPDGTLVTNDIDSRILKAAEANHTIVAAHAVSVSSIEDDIRWYALDVSSGTPVLKDQGNVGAGDYT
jgi:hypothetical protein